MTGNMPRHILAGGLVVLLVVCAQLMSTTPGIAPSPAALETASRIVQASGAPGGICAVVGCSDADVALTIAKQGNFVVQCLATDQATCDRLRKQIRARGMYGTVSANTLAGGRLPYTENLVNLVVVNSYPSLADPALMQDEVLRVLAPLGTACFAPASVDSAVWTKLLKAQLRSRGVQDISDIPAGPSQHGWTCMKKPWPAEIDQWTHYLHGPDGNPVAQDRVVGPPKHYQWIGDPVYLQSHENDSSVSTLVTAQGRLFAIVDEAPISLEGPTLPGNWFLEARDAFNGVLLWKVPIRRWGWREWKHTWFTNRPGDFPLNIQKRLVALGDKVYVTLGYRAPVSELDARTGELLKTYDGTEGTGEILYLNGALVLSVPAGDQVKVMAVDAATGRQKWVSEKAYRGSTTDYLKWSGKSGGVEPAKLDPALNIAADGTAVALLDGPEIVCLDFQSGKERWRSAFPQVESDRTSGGIASQGDLWVGTMIVRDGVVLHASPNNLAAISAESGKVLWQQPKKYLGHLWYEWKDVFVIDDTVWTWSSELDEAFINMGGKQQHEFWPHSANGYDLKTGKLKKQVPTGPIFKAEHHHRCYRDKATVRYILASRRGSEFVDLQEGQHTVDNWVRGTCHVGMMPANGLQYAPPHPCQCYIEEKINGMNALAPERPSAAGQAGPPSGPQLERGPAFGKTDGPDAGQDDWPAFRHDSARTGASDTQVAGDAAPLWRTQLGLAVSAPIVVGDRIFAALVDEHHVVCLDAQDGTQVWEFAAGARIDSPPTYDRGAVLFGSADGWVYSVRASDGQLAWRFRAAPEERLIGAFGQLESAWPVHGSVLVQNGIVYFAAGRSSHLDGGIYLYGLDASSGQIRHQTRIEGPYYTAQNIEQNNRLPMGALPDVLQSDGTTLYMRTKAFDAELKPAKGKPELEAKGGFLDATYFKRMPWTYGGQDNFARLIVHDGQSAYYLRMFDTLRGLDPTVFFTPGAQGYLLFARHAGSGKDAWAERIPVRARAMALTAGRLFVAGPPDVVDPKDPLGAFEGRKGGLFYAIDPASGQKLAEQAIPSPPVFNGIAAAHGRLYLVEEDGSMTCFGKR